MKGIGIALALLFAAYLTDQYFADGKYTQRGKAHGHPNKAFDRHLNRQRTSCLSLPERVSSAETAAKYKAPIVPKSSYSKHQATESQKNKSSRFIVRVLPNDAGSAC